MKIVLKISMLSLYLCLFNSGNKSFAQIEKGRQKYRTYSTYYFKGCGEMSREDYLKAILYFDSASVVCPYFHKPYYENIFCYARLNNYQAAYDNCVKMTMTGIRFPIAHDVLGGFKDSDLFKKFLKEEDSIYNSAMRRYDAQYCNRLAQIINLRESTCQLRPIKGEKDTSSYFHQFALLCKQNDFPTPNTVGVGLYRDAIGICENSMMYGYSDSEDWQIVLAGFNKEVESCQVELDFIYMLEDVYLYEQGKPVKYGFWATSKMFPDMKFPSISEMNKNRREAGFADFELYLGSMGEEKLDKFMKEQKTEH